MRKVLRLGLPVAGVALLAALVSEGDVSAASFIVNSTVDAVDANPGDGICATATADCTLRAAVMEANALPGADTIELPAGTYTVTIPGAGENAAATGDLDVTSALAMSGAGSGETVIDAAGLDRAFQTVGFDFSLRINDLTIKNGNAEGEDGGGIFNGSTIALALDHVAIVHNTATYFGGGVRSNSYTSSLSISNGVFSGNYADQGGAAISNPGSATITDSTITGNSARLGAGAIDNNNGVSLHITNSTVQGNSGNIGAIFGGSLTIDHTSVIENRSTVGGAIFGGGAISVTQSDLSRNTANFGQGGGIYYLGGSADEMGLELTDSTISDNKAAFEGGGIFAWTPAKVVITNSTISGNEAGTSEAAREKEKRGGGVFALFGQLQLTNVTISGNQADVGGGILNNVSNDGVGFIELKNTIVAGNTNGDCSGSIRSAGHNLSSDGTCGLAEPGDLENAGPKLAPLADNGGPTQTHNLLAESPAIDAADNAACPTMDQRGVGRPVDGNSDGVAVCDIGAYEAAAGTTPPRPSSTPAPRPNPTVSPPAVDLPAAFPQTGGPR